MATVIGLSALRAASEGIDAVSNNIANAQTIGYKSGQYIFQDEFFRASDPQNPSRTGMGVSASHIRRSQTNGTIISTSNPLDIAVGGMGMFTTAKTVVNGTNTGNPSQFQYTRNGQFGVDNQSRIVNANGNFLIGYPANTDGSIRTDVKSVLTLSQAPLPGSQTTSNIIELNLDNTTDPKSSTFDPTNSATYNQSTSQTVFDSTGLAHTLSMFYVKQPSVPLAIKPSSTTAPSITNNGTSAVGIYNFDTKQSSLGTDGTTTTPITVATTSSPNAGQGGTSIQSLNNTQINLVSGQTYKITLADASTISATGKTYGTPTSYSVSAAVLAANNVTVTSTGGTNYTIPRAGGGGPVITLTSDGLTPPTSFTVTKASLDALTTPAVAQSVATAGGQNFTIPVRTAAGADGTLNLTGNNFPTEFTVPTSRFAMYATMDGIPVPGNQSGAAKGFPQGVVSPGGTNYSLGTMAFVAGKNIDSLARDAYGTPQFKTLVNMTTAVGGAVNPNTLSFTMDSTNMTAFSSVAQTYSNSQDGQPQSQLSSYSFDSSGKLIAQYANGKSKVQGQVLLSYFGNDGGLIPVGGNSFDESAESGAPTQGVPGSGLFGELKTQALEQSNVDLTSQLVNLMSLQRQYSAASQVVKVATALQDDVLQRLT